MTGRRASHEVAGLLAVMSMLAMATAWLPVAVAQEQSAKEGTPPAAAGPAVDVAATAAAEIEWQEKISSIGVAEAVQGVDVSGSESGVVAEILFDSGKAEIKPEGRDVLLKVGNVLRTVQDKQIRIEGYTDTVPIGAALRGRYPTNWELSTQRATTVLRFLQEKGGVDGKYLAAMGYGPYRPVADNTTDEGRAENRRIEIVLTPLDASGASSGEVQASP